MMMQASSGCAGAGCILLPLFLFVGAFAAAVLLWRRSYDRSVAQQSAIARAAYDESLAQLRGDPTNATLRQQALEYGRAWVAKGKRGHVYAVDELSLANEINAACAGATTAPPPHPEHHASIEDRLHQLDALKARGTISDTEYTESRNRILGEM